MEILTTGMLVLHLIFNLTILYRLNKMQWKSLIFLKVVNALARIYANINQTFFFYNIKSHISDFKGCKDQII